MKGPEEERIEHGMACIDENLFIVGGEDAAEEYYFEITKRMEMYNSKTTLWELKAPMKMARKYAIGRVIHLLFDHCNIIIQIINIFYTF